MASVILLISLMRQQKQHRSMMFLYGHEAFQKLAPLWAICHFVTAGHVVIKINQAAIHWPTATNTA